MGFMGKYWSYSEYILRKFLNWTLILEFLMKYYHNFLLCLIFFQNFLWGHKFTNIFLEPSSQVRILFSPLPVTSNSMIYLWQTSLWYIWQKLLWLICEKHLYDSFVNKPISKTYLWQHIYDIVVTSYLWHNLWQNRNKHLYDIIVTKNAMTYVWQTSIWPW